MTSQLPETLMIDGESLDLFTTPLAPWLAQQGLRIASGRVASICARGYRGLWQIKAGRRDCVTWPPLAPRAACRCPAGRGPR